MRHGELARGGGFGSAIDVPSDYVVDVDGQIVGSDDADDTSWEGCDAMAICDIINAFGLVGLEGGYVGGVGGDDDGAGVGGVGVLPLEEVEACKGTGCQHNASASRIGAASFDYAHFGIGGECGDGVGVGLVGCKVGGIGGVAGDGYGARGVGVAVVPLHEVVARVGCCRDGDGGACRVGASTADAAHGRVGREDGERVGVGRIGGKVGGIGGVAGDGDGA